MIGNSTCIDLVSRLGSAFDFLRCALACNSRNKSEQSQYASQDDDGLDLCIIGVGVVASCIANLVSLISPMAEQTNNDACAGDDGAPETKAEAVL